MIFAPSLSATVKKVMGDEREMIEREAELAADREMIEAVREKEGSMKSDLVDITVSKHAETAEAVLVSDTGHSAEAKWLPKSQIEIEPASQKGLFVVTMPEWLAIDKGFV